MTNTEAQTAVDVRPDDALLAIDGIDLWSGGLLVENARWATNGDIVLTVWGATRMIEIRVYATTSVRFRRPAERDVAAEDLDAGFMAGFGS